MYFNSPFGRTHYTVFNSGDLFFQVENPSRVPHPPEFTKYLVDNLTDVDGNYRYFLNDNSGKRFITY